MTKEEKQILLQDLCAKLPYGVKVQVYSGNMYAPAILTSIDVKKQECIFNFNVPVEYCLSYLRPMSSMTKEEEAIYEQLINDVHYKARPSTALRLVNWLDKNMFDHRGLIPADLALEATEGMYNT